MAKGTTLLDKNKNIVYPRTIIEQVYNKAGTARLDVLLGTMRENLEGDIADTNVVVARLRADLDALLADSTLSGEVLDAIVEIKTLLDSNSSDVVAELVATMSALRDEAIRNVAQELTLSQKQQARQNIDAAGVSATYGDGLATLSYGGNAIFPETKGNQVKLSIGGNAEDAIKANGGNIEKERVRAIAREDEIATELSETKEKVDTFLADADTSELAIDKLKELQEYIKNDETSASQMLGDIAQNKQDIADNAESLEKEATRAKQVEMYLESQKANKYGYYENLSVGIADNLSGRGEATESEFSFRPSGGENKSIEDGTARINSIKGNSVVLNQQIDNTKWEAQYSESFVNNGGVFIVKGTPPSDGRGYFLGIRQQLNNLLRRPIGDIILLICDYYPIGTTSFGYNYCGYTKTVFGLKENDWNNISLIFTITNQSTASHSDIVLYGGDKAEELRFKNIEVVNLTKMFNGVNVPTTVEEFKPLYGNMLNEYKYNAGTIIDNHTTAIKSVGVNAWDEEWEVGLLANSTGQLVNTDFGRASKNFTRVINGQSYRADYKDNNIISPTHLYFYKQDKSYIGVEYNIESGKNIIIPSDCEFVKFGFGDNARPFKGIPEMSFHLVHTGYLNGRYFPYESQTRELPTVDGGLKSAGSAYDEIRYNKGKDKWEHVKRIGSVDLGTLDWVLAPTQTEGVSRFYSTKIKDAVAVVTTEDKGNIICGKYIRVSPTDTYMLNKGVAINFDVPRLFIYDPTFTDVATFKQAMQGVILNYELAKPVVTELDVDISPDYKVWDYGTEEAISEVLSTPARINTNYGFNAVGQITDNTELIKELLARVAVLEAQIAQANSTSTETIEPVVE